MKRITVEVNDALKDALDKYCETEGRTLKWVVREALIDVVEEWDDVRAVDAVAHEINDNELETHTVGVW